MNVMSVADDAVLTIAGQKVPMVESITMRARRTIEPVSGYGLVQPQAYQNAAASYEVELRRIRLPIGEGFDRLDFFSLDNFTVSIHRDGVEIGFTGCRWSEVEETLSGNQRMLQRVILTATGREVA